MAKILVTGSTGQLGEAVLRALLKVTEASDIVALARDARKALPLKWLGIEIRYGDYTDHESLIAAFAGVTKIYLVGAAAFSDRVTLHKNVIDAAKLSGVQHIFYASIQRACNAISNLEVFKNSDIQTERLIKESGLKYTIVRHPIYSSEILNFIGLDSSGENFTAPAGEGRVSFTCVRDLADAAATLLTQSGHEGRTYILNNGDSFSFHEMAELLSKLLCRPISYYPISAESFESACERAGWSPTVIRYICGWFFSIENNAFKQTTLDLEKLIGRKPKDIGQIFREVFRIKD